MKEDKKIDPAFTSQLDCLLALESLDLNTITPIQAIEYLSSIQRELLRIKAEEEEKKEKVFWQRKRRIKRILLLLITRNLWPS